MLTQDEIEDSFETAFLHTVEDLPDAQLQLMMHNVRELRRLAPPSLAVSRAREIVDGVLLLRAPPPPEPAPEPLPEPAAEVAVDAGNAETTADAGIADEAVAAEKKASDGDPQAIPADEAPEAKTEDAAPPGWAHPSVTLEMPSTPLRRMMHWFFG
ncbi:MAG TPA: hypothetical protein VM661_15840 [Candidatus Sulfotelmatobacter sp.]|jgi:hypothetical protein|nr:hypothetical protein [Candidatus Sulfotelmatobacter sp.]